MRESSQYQNLIEEQWMIKRSKWARKRKRTWWWPRRKSKYR